MSTRTDPTAPPSRSSSALSDRSSPVEKEQDPDPDFDALRAREPWAVRRWIVPQRTYLRSVLARYGVPRRELREHVQETLFQALRSLPDFRGDARLRTWLYSVARNVAYRYHRTDGRQAALEPDVLEDVQHQAVSSPCLAEATDDPEATTIQRERHALVRRALQNLPDHYQQVIQLRDLDERTTDEAAEAIGITNVNTRVRLHRARNTLHGLLQAYMDDDGRRR
jgi:RNA polymerase sigma-70 factor (ECF subfamily)